MTVVIVGGNECMECKYKQIWKAHGCRAKVFTKMRGNFTSQIGSPDIIVLFTGTVSHKMAGCAFEAAGRCGSLVLRCQSSSASALSDLLKNHMAAGS